jgi:hypothetical protein
MSGFGTLWRVQTRKHIRTRHSIRTSTGPARSAWPRLQETESLMLEKRRSGARQRLHENRRTCRTSLLWP